MKDTLLTAVGFDKTNKTLDFSGVVGFDIRNLWAVVNLTRKTIIYAIGTTGKGYTTVVGTTITLEFDTTAYANTDDLFIVYSNNLGTASETTLSALNAKFPTQVNGALPTSLPIASASGNITTQNLVPAGNATVNSAVEITLNGANGLIIQSTGVYTGALSLQLTVDGTNWITLGGVPLINLNTGGYLATITSGLQSIFQAEVTGAIKARITALAAVTGGATISLRAVQTGSMVALDAALPTGANVIGGVNQGGTWTVMPGNTPNTSPWLITPAPSAAQGYSTTHKLISAGSTNATSVKASAGTIGSIIVSNKAGAAIYFKLYNKASAPVVGTDVPVMTLMIPNNNTIPIPISAMGLRLSTGIAYALTALIADSDNTIVTASDVAVFINYI